MLCIILCVVVLPLGNGNRLKVVGANLTLYLPSWSASKRCVIGPRILFDCRVTVNPETGLSEVCMGLTDCQTVVDDEIVRRIVRVE